MEFLKLISYWRNMFGDGQGTMVFEKNRVADYGCWNLSTQAGNWILHGHNLWVGDTLKPQD